MDTCGSHTAAWHASLDNQIAGMPVYEANYPQLGGRRRKRKSKKTKRIKSKQLKKKTKKRKSNKRSKKKSKIFRR